MMPPPRAARDIAISVRRMATDDPANYAPGPFGEPRPGPPAQWPVRLAAAVFTAVAACLVWLSFQLAAPWRYVVAAASIIAVRAFWSLVHPDKFAGRHRAPQGHTGDDIDQLEAKLGPRVTVIEFGGSSAPPQRQASDSPAPYPRRL
jgi:hypothetical protein